MKNRKGITWGKGEDFGFIAKWVAICEEHSTVADDTNGKRIRTLGPSDFCECHNGTCAQFVDCYNCGREAAIR